MSRRSQENLASQPSRRSRGGPCPNGVDATFMQVEVHGWDIHAVSAPYPRRDGGHHRSHAAGWRAGVSPQPPRGAGRAGRRRVRTTRTRHPRTAHRASPLTKIYRTGLRCAAWLSFAPRTSRAGLRWPAHDRKQRQTMVFGESSGAACDPAGRRQPEITSPARTAPRRPFRQAKRADRPSAVPAFPAQNFMKERS